MRAVSNLLIRVFVVFSFCFIASTQAATVKNPQKFDMRVQKVEHDINKFFARLKKDSSNSSEIKSFQNRLLHRLHVLEQEFRNPKSRPGATNGTRDQLKKIHDLKSRIKDLQTINRAAPSELNKFNTKQLISAPPNDDCINATPIGDGTFSGETLTATNDGSSSCDERAAPDVWFRYTATVDGTIVATSTGSDYDTVLSVHDPTINGCPGEESDEITCNDDCGGLQSCIGFDVVTGNEYLIRMSGFFGDAGNYVLTVGLAGGISGTVTDAGTSAPIPFEQVDIFTSSGQFASYGYTDASGNYTVNNLTEGTYFAATNLYGENYIDELYDDVVCEPFCDTTTGTPIVVTAGSITPGIDFALDKGGTISGTIIDEANSAPLESVYVDIYDSNGNYFSYGYTDANGNYVAGSLLTGSYREITINYLNYVDELFDDIVCEPSCDITIGTPIPVTQGSDTPNIDFALALGGTVSGHITDAATASPLPGVGVIIFDGSGNFSGYGYTDESGDYTTYGALITGDYFALTDNYANYIDELYDDIPCPLGNCDPTTGTPISVTSGSNTPGIDFALDFDCSSTTIIVDPSTLPDGIVDVPYNQDLTASGGVEPYIFAVTSGALPAGLTLAADGNLTGTPTTAEIANFTITATDTHGCSGSQTYSITIAGPPFLFSDDFEDGTLPTGWIYRGNWSETGGNLVGSHTRRGFAIANPAFSGCTMCAVSTTMQTIVGGKVSLLAWHTGNMNYVELIMKEDKDRWVLKQRNLGFVAAKTKFKQVIDPNVSYAVDISFDGTNFQVLLNGTPIMTMPAAASPFGTVGFKIKSTNGTFGFIQVQ